MKIPNILKENYKGLIFNILSYIVIIYIYIYTKHNILILINIIYAYSFITYIYSKLKNNEFSFKDTILFSIKIYISLLVIMYGIKYLGYYGIAGFIIIVLGISAYRLIKGRKLYMQGIREIETMIFGKTLDKENYNKEENKNGKS